MEQVDVGIVVGCGGDRGAAQRDDLADIMRAPRDVVDARPLDVHARDENHVGPRELLRRGALNVLVDEHHLPLFRDQFHHQQDALWRHEALHVAHEREGVVEGAEAVAVTREDAEDLALVQRMIIAQDVGLGFGFDKRVAGHIRYS
jgi:hypothetical protein